MFYVQRNLEFMKQDRPQKLRPNYCCCYTFIKASFTILLSSILLCGCSQKHTTSAGPAIDRIQAGKVSSWSYGFTVSVDKRDGTNVEGIWISGKLPDGKKMTISADTGSISPAASPESVGSVTNDRAVIFFLHNAEQQIGDWPLRKKDMTFMVY